MSKKRAVMALSGGLDSACTLAYLIENGYEVSCYGFRYGSKHNELEIEKACALCTHYKVPYLVVDVMDAFKPMKSNLMAGQGEIPEGHYEDKSMEQTVVPGRNMIFLSLMAGYAWSDNAQFIGIGIHRGDHAIYADCRKEFFLAMDSALYLGTDKRVEILAPFITNDKAEIVRYGLMHNVPFHLTRTCYKSQELACGKCGSCQERKLAFQEIGIKDPIKYEN